MTIRRVGLAATITIGILAASLTAGQAQEPRKIPRLGFLSIFSPSDIPLWREAFRQGLQDLGYTEGHNIVIEYRYAKGRPELLPGLATELVGLKMDIIAAETTPASLAAKQATTKIPIVMTIVADPMKSGLVFSLARPGGNITGLSLQLPDVTAKRVQLLREVVPQVSRVTILWNSSGVINTPQFEAAEAAARVLGIQLDFLGVQAADDFPRAFQAAARRGTGALLVLDDFLFTRHMRQIAALTAKTRLPAMYGTTGFAEAGGLVSYGPNYAEISRRAATYVDKILKGAQPGELPIEQPTTLELVINVKTAKAFGLTIPPSLLLRADRIIQ